MALLTSFQKISRAVWLIYRIRLIQISAYLQTHSNVE